MAENKMEKVLLSAYKKLISKLKELDFIESISLIGKHIGKRTMDKVMDIDVIIIVKIPMTSDKYNRIENIFKNVCKKYTNPKTDVLYAIADGPMKPKSFKENEIFLHCILHTKESYRKMPLLLCKNSWQQFNPVTGKPLKKLQSFEGVTKKMLLNSALGVNHLIELVSKDSSGYIGWKKDKNGIMKWKLFPLKFKHDEEKAELYIYAVLRCASNALRYLTKDNSIGIDGKMAGKFKTKFKDLKYEELPSILVSDKKLLRNKKYKGNIKVLKKQTLAFLKELKKHIK